MNDTCVFCRISQNKINSNIVFENDLIKCFLDAEPINEGHILIIPKAHYLDADELPDDVACEIMRSSQRILKALRQCYDFPGYSIMQNGGIFNDVGHYHLHIFPRYGEGDFGWTFGETKSEAFNQKVAIKLKEILCT